ncbi:MAG TPA: hypothetical protein VJ836_00585 [Candidatus Saccharimonadales bacterium]|nr:hypothetical protein [Candidatus Saccharimonadales bacterium]
MSTKEIAKNAKDTARGVKVKVKETIAVIEAFAWLGVLLACGTVIWHVFKGYLTLEEPYFYALIVSTSVIAVRAMYELGDYLRKAGNGYER